MEQWIIEVIGAFGYVGIFLLMLAENVFPPIPSEVIMPVAGLAVGAGRMNFTVVLLAALAGTLLGNLPWYLIARLVGRQRFLELTARWGKYAAVKPADVQAAIAWFDRHGSKAVLLGRLAPGVRTLISIPAGLSEMPFGRFLVLSTIGSAVWITFLLLAGVILHDNWHTIADIIGPLGTLFVATVAVGFVVWIGWRRWSDRRAAADIVTPAPGPGDPIG
ncbi:DedA family protein [uncultured Amaricoccus sp.]|uniref:DedA family protein n=1 Tax=uncultured Amaricoccus sp. TaxID=339341 RepID=UPI002633EDEF|nr:DedA family protein [uncultured Amaricoccus sp.]